MPLNAMTRLGFGPVSSKAKHMLRKMMFLVRVLLVALGVINISAVLIYHLWQHGFPSLSPFTFLIMHCSGTAIITLIRAGSGPIPH